MDHIKLVNDESQCEAYTRGKIGYYVLKDSIKESIKNPFAQVVGIAGFSFSLLVWAYECIPLLTGSSIFCAKRAS